VFLLAESESWQDAREEAGPTGCLLISTPHAARPALIKWQTNAQSRKIFVTNVVVVVAAVLNVLDVLHVLLSPLESSSSSSSTHPLLVLHAQHLLAEIGSGALKEKTKEDT